MVLKFAGAERGGNLLVKRWVEILPEPTRLASEPFYRTAFGFGGVAIFLVPNHQIVQTQ